MEFERGGLPLFLPGLAVFALVATAGCRRLARALDARPAIAWMLVMSVGLILSATLTPQGAAFAGATGSSTCDLTRMGPATLSEYLTPGDTSGNVLLFIPLGVMIGLLPRSRGRAVLLVVAITLPFAVEATQLLLPALDRACESADVVDNLLGLAIGLALAMAGGFMAQVGHRRQFR